MRLHSYKAKVSNILVVLITFIVVTPFPSQQCYLCGNVTPATFLIYFAVYFQSINVIELGSAIFNRHFTKSTARDQPL